jgi:hypothetical protein
MLLLSSDRTTCALEAGKELRGWGKAAFAISVRSSGRGTCTVVQHDAARAATRSAVGAPISIFSQWVPVSAAAHSPVIEDSSEQIEVGPVPRSINPQAIAIRRARFTVFEENYSLMINRRSTKANVT